VLGRGYYARQDTLTPAIVGTAVTVISVPLFWALGNRFFATGVATASAAAIALYTAALSCVWCYRFGSCAFAGLQTVFIKIGAISFAAAMPSFLLMRIEIIDSVHHPYIEALVEILASGVVFATLFLGLSIALVPSLIRPLLERFGPFRRYFNR
jgi:putative peptidoglycan lipid II flippase